MQLFDDLTERDETPPPARRTEFGYLNASGIAMAAQIREFLQSAFERYSGDKAGLRGRFRSPLNSAHLGAAFELVLHELAHRTGHAPLADVSLPDGNIDLRLALQNHGNVWLEARMLQDNENVHFARVRDLLDNMTVEGVQLDLEMISPLNGPVSERGFRAAIAAYLKDLDAYSQVAVDGSTLGEPLIYTDDVNPSLKVIARRNREYGNSVISHVPDAEMPSAHDLRIGLERKAQKYRSLNEPYIIALCSSKMFVTDDLFEEALFSRREDAEGLWARERNSRVSAVLACYRFKPSAIGGAQVRLFHNPQAIYPVGENLFGCEQVRMTDGRLVRAGDDSFARLLGLPAEWPRAA